MMNTTKDISPVKASERFAILDILRGFALLGICMANFPEFSLYNFLPQEVKSSMSTAAADNITRWLLYIFVDGKFYTLFSLLFGIGFSIIIRNAERKGANGFRIFYRRMGLLLVIGFMHLMFIWSGDILMLYALLGMLLPLFRRMSDKGLLRWAAFFLLLPVLIDFVCEITHTSLALPFVRLQEMYCARYGINADNFAYWLRDAEDYGTVFQFLVQGAFVRMQEFIEGNRYFKVLGLFLTGFFIGRNRIYADMEEKKALLSKVFRYGLAIGLPCSFLYAWSAMGRHPLGIAMHSVFYLASVYPLGFAYAAGSGLFYLRTKNGMEVARTDRTDGLDQLHRTVRYRYVSVLWHWHGLRDYFWIVTDRNCCAGRISFSNGIQCRMDVRLQVRTIGMGLADADLRQMAWNQKLT